MIKITDLSYRYAKAKTASLTQVNLSLNPGHAYALLGPNGAGKTTLVSLMAGILPLQTGQLFIDGLNSQKQLRDIQQFVSLVPQEYAFYPRLTGLENLQFFAGMHALKGTEKKQRLQEAVEFVDLTAHLKKPAHTYSGGLKRRLNLAIALLNQPRLLILDEPTVGLDPQNRHYIVERLNQLRRQGVTLIYTSHLLDEVQRLCDQLILIDDGQVKLNCSMTQALPLDAGQRITITTATTFNPEQLGLKKPESMHQYGDHVETLWLSSPAQSNALLQQLLAQLTHAGIALKTVKLEDARLEDIFLALTHRAPRD